ncbi:MAG: hypothetical protein FWG08_04625 [Propionibacteriaceae bacterium]|nr:hypothetical protein [Propionibacteriaceae bacterium]
MPEQLLVGFDPSTAQARVAMARSRIPMRVVWVIFAALISGVLYYLRKEMFTPLFAGLLFGLSIGISLLMLLQSIFAWIGAKKYLAKLPQGIAAAVDRQGVWVRGTGMAWADVTALRVTRGNFGRAPTFQVTRIDGQVASLQLDDVDVMAGTIDAAVRAYSAGAHYVDTTSLGH